MERAPFLFRTNPTDRDEALQRFAALLSKESPCLAAAGAQNVSLWQAEDLIFGYLEAQTRENLSAIGTIVRGWEAELGGAAQLIASPGNMRRMYTALGNPRADKTGLGHRVFMTRLKPGMAQEYRDRHAAIEGNAAQDSPVNNFTIWNCGDYICGYAELDKGYVIDRSAQGMEKDRPWESRMLEVMDWLTDDVNALFGFENKPVRCLFDGNR